ncbi:NAD(P)-dependent oxidoreductase [Dongia rigui]|uniref:NAD(P)-dependent oxidoreductase n=1 Tax=Dongia rigui TaxID=940149 RepID=A0ABU5E2H7_9PROT|nr:NAD(P)-dependent oxidoreductase [Dongia rigui]MDY0873567.1 NAD(P)-dependent oxidoreductase [Dongia rigui]
MNRILITPRSLTSGPHPQIDRLRDVGFEIITSTPNALPSEAELISLLPGCVGWLAGIEPVSPQVIAAARDLRIISRNGTGIDNLPLDDLRKRNIAVATAGGANAGGVAELAVALIFSALRHVPAADAGIKQGGWPRRRGRELRGRHVAVIGCGAIGGEVVRMLSALGARVLAYDPAQPDLRIGADRFTWMDLGTALREADIITFHCPLQKTGKPILDAATIATLRPGVLIVNTARAALVDEGAILAGLNSGAIESYATDVFDEEPPKDLTLARHPRVIATSHIGGFTDESVERATSVAIDHLLAALRPMAKAHVG